MIAGGFVNRFISLDNILERYINIKNEHAPDPAISLPGMRLALDSSRCKVSPDQEHHDSLCAMAQGWTQRQCPRMGDCKVYHAVSK